MKKRILIAICTLITVSATQAQVTQINSNKSLQVTFQLTTTTAIAVSATDSSIWVTDGTLAGTVQISPTIKYEGDGDLLSGKLIFRGSTLATGSELYITDATPGGTMLVQDIVAGSVGSKPGEFTLLNNVVYFTAETAVEGRELWRTNGTSGGTALVKDIVAGSLSSNRENQYHLVSTGSYLLFAAQNAATGVELWKSDGTNGGTNLLIDINTGNAGADSSNPSNFYILNSVVLFTATEAINGGEIWKTDGTVSGTVLLKDINPGIASSTTIEFFGFSTPFFLGFHTFNNKAYFQANDGTSVGELWVTDGTPGNTSLVKNIVSSTSLSLLLLVDAVNLPGKFIFPVSDFTGRSELWESDGTNSGTNLFKSFTPPTAGDPPAIFVPYIGDISNGTFTQSLFQGNKFFFTAGTSTEGYELWISDGTIGGTSVVKDINAGVPNGIDSNHISYIYTANNLYFPAINAANGVELWKTDGTASGTTIVADIVTGAVGSNPVVSGSIINGKILFEADNGDSPTTNPLLTDLYAVDGSFTPLPISLADFTIVPVGIDALLNWHTLQEINSRDFIIQRSFDGENFDNIGTIAAHGNSTSRQGYTFTDAGIINSIQSLVYYRLLATDIDGKTAYSKVVTLRLKSHTWQVRLLANPVLDEVKLAVSGVAGNVQVYINNFEGKAVYSNKQISANGIIRIPAASLPHGMYVLVITNRTDKKSMRFVK